MARTKDKETRRAELISAAMRVFGKKGVTNTTISDIVRAAGVAQGTYYLYFDDKDDILVAIAEKIVKSIIEATISALDTSASAEKQLRTFIGAFGNFPEEPNYVNILEIINRPENRLLHDRFESRMAPQLAPLIENIIERGIHENVFEVVDTRISAWFIMGGLRGIELAGMPTDQLPRVMELVTELVLRVLGYETSS